MRIPRQAICARGAVAGYGLGAHSVHMVRGEKQPHYIRQWRKHRGLTLEKLAVRIGMTHQNLGKVERFKVPYSQQLLEALAEALQCSPADLIMRDPSQMESIWSIWDDIPPTDRPPALRALAGFRKTGTHS